MPVRRPLLGLIAAAGLAALAAHAAAAPARQTAFVPPAKGLTTAVYYSASASDAALFYRRGAAAGARAVRIHVYWSAIAPAAEPAPDFRPSDPRDPAYTWTVLDREVTDATRRGFEPILTISNPPMWARLPVGSTTYLAVGAPALEDYAAFATALVTRYSGRIDRLPRVRYWMAWNEPNAIYYWAPQYEGGKPMSPAYYRSVLARFSAIAHRVRADNLVIAGGLSPFTRDKPETMAPLRFMRELLCMSNGSRPRRTCAARAVFDIWSHHPYTSGNATHHAVAADDVSLGDLPEMRRLLDAAVRAGHVVTRRHVQFWVTEFSWDTNPPDPNGVPVQLHARWVAEALYRMWLSGINLVTWLQLRDAPYPDEDYQSGLYFRGPSGIASGRPKPALRAFRFPFVAFARSGRVSYWGRTPTSRAERVLVERRTTGGRWRRVATTRAGAAGIFYGRVRSSAAGAFRARAVGEISLAFSLAVSPDLAVTPFGTGPRG